MKAFFGVFGEVYHEEFDTAESTLTTGFNQTKDCIASDELNHRYSDLSTSQESRCPNIEEKSDQQFLYRFFVFMFIFIINVILQNILIGQISMTLQDAKEQKMDIDYFYSALGKFSKFIIYSKW